MKIKAQKNALVIDPGRCEGPDRARLPLRNDCRRRFQKRVGSALFNHLWRQWLAHEVRYANCLGPRFIRNRAIAGND